MGGGPVVGVVLWGGSLFVLVDECVGVHWADDGFGVVVEVLSRGDVDGEDFMLIWESGLEEGVDCFACGFGGAVPVGVLGWISRFALRAALGIEVEGDGDCGDTDECGFDCGGDGSGVDDIDAAVCAGVHSGDDEVWSCALAVVFWVEVCEREF